MSLGEYSYPSGPGKPRWPVLNSSPSLAIEQGCDMSLAILCLTSRPYRLDSLGTCILLKPELDDVDDSHCDDWD